MSGKEISFKELNDFRFLFCMVIKDFTITVQPLGHAKDIISEV